jgi:Rrf2 family protein
MQLTRAADYAVRVMTYLASEPAGTVVSKTVLAKASDAPDSFVSKILQSLARAGLIEARRGVDGGFLMLDRGAKASLLDVVESIDGPISLNVCLSAEGNCVRSRSCAAHAVWRQAQEAMLNVLRQAKIADMANSHGCSGTSMQTIAAAGASGQAEKDRSKHHGRGLFRLKR